MKSSHGTEFVVDALGTEKPLVSVVIPTQDRAELLARAIQSVIAQSYKNLEIIIVDDASSDDTHKIVAGFDDARIRYVRHDVKKGGAAARNTGIRNAVGTHIAFLDDDDEWEPEKTEAQLRVLDRYDAVLCDYSMDGQGSRAGERLGGRATVSLDDLRRGFAVGGSSSALMARACVMKETMFDESLPKAQDWDVCIRVAQRYTLAFLDRPLFRYNDGDHSRISTRPIDLSPEQFDSALRMLHKNKNFFGEAWFARHMAREMLYGIKRRHNKGELVLYVARHYGLNNVIKALLERLQQLLAERRWKKSC